MFVKNLKYNLPDKDGFFGEFGGAFVPEDFKKVLKNLDREFEKAINEESFLDEVYDDNGELNYYCNDTDFCDEQCGDKK